MRSNYSYIPQCKFCWSVTCRIPSNPGSVSRDSTVQISWLVLCGCWSGSLTAPVSSLPWRVYLVLQQ